MKFAEITQEVQVARPHDIYADIGLTPGRRRIHQLARDAPGNCSDCIFCFVGQISLKQESVLSQTDRMTPRVSRVLANCCVTV